ncbi:MAG: PEP-CTERM sorting domain-containing protein [Phycisphaerales bacterium]
MLKKKFLRFLTIIFAFNAFAFAGSILNPGFENVIAGSKFDTPANWNAVNYAAAISVLDMGSSAFPGNKSLWKVNAKTGLTPHEGSKFALLSNGPGDVYFGKLSQNISVNAGDVISGAYFFGTCDVFFESYDYAYIRLIAPSGSGLSNIELVYINMLAVGVYGSTNGWQTFESEPLPFSGTYTLECGVYDGYDSIYETYFAVDGLHITPVPEPATLMLLATGFFFYRRKRKI